MNKKMKIYPLKIEDISYPRRIIEDYYSQDELFEMIENVKNGDTSNIIIVKFSTNGYELVKGKIVLEAYRILNRKIIPAHIQR